MKEKIILALMELLHTRGIKFTMDDLVHALHVSKSTLYNHFRSKDEMLEAMMDYILATLAEKDEKILADNIPIEEKILAMSCVSTEDIANFQNHVYHYLYNIPRIQDKIKSSNRKRFIRINKLLEEGIEAGVIRSDFNRTVFFQVLLLSQRGLMNPHVLNQLKIPYGKSITEMVRILLHGILK